jgi:hypothetical protein
MPFKVNVDMLGSQQTGPGLSVHTEETSAKMSRSMLFKGYVSPLGEDSPKTTNNLSPMGRERAPLRRRMNHREEANNRSAEERAKKQKQASNQLKIYKISESTTQCQKTDLGGGYQLFACFQPNI